MSHDQGSRHAWLMAALDRYEGPLVRYAFRLAGGDLERARDVVQDTFMRLWEADRAAVDRHLAAWLYTVCRNRALELYRKDRRVTALEAEQLEAHAGEDPGLGDPSHTMGFRRGGVQAAIESLPARQQEIIRLKFQGGLSYKEISEVMNISVSNVGFLLHTAVKALRGMLDISDETPSSTSRPGR